MMTKNDLATSQHCQDHHMSKRLINDCDTNLLIVTKCFQIIFRLNLHTKLKYIYPFYPSGFLTWVHTLDLFVFMFLMADSVFIHFEINSVYCNIVVSLVCERNMLTIIQSIVLEYFIRYSVFRMFSLRIPLFLSFPGEL